MENVAPYLPDTPTNVNIESNLHRAACLISEATSLYVCTGAGMSVDAGIPDYRGPGEEGDTKTEKSQWASDPEVEALYGITTAQKSEANWFIKDPTAAWGYEINFIRKIVQCAPHEGYHSLQRILVERFPSSHFVLTSNIDCMHLRSGIPNELYYSCYGSLFDDNDMSKIRIQCSHHGSDSCKGEEGVRTIAWDNIVVDHKTGRAKMNTIPVCQVCKRPARLNLLMFKDQWANTKYIMGKGSKHRVHHMKYLKKYTGKKKHNLVVLEIGAGNHIPTIRRRAYKVVRDTILAGGKATLVRINLFQSLPDRNDQKYNVVNGVEMYKVVHGMKIKTHGDRLGMLPQFMRCHNIFSFLSYKECARTSCVCHCFWIDFKYALVHRFEPGLDVPKNVDKAIEVKETVAAAAAGETKGGAEVEEGVREFISLPLSARDAMCRIEELLKNMAPPQAFVEEEMVEEGMEKEESIAVNDLDFGYDYDYSSCSSSSSEEEEEDK